MSLGRALVVPRTIHRAFSSNTTRECSLALQNSFRRPKVGRNRPFCATTLTADKVDLNESSSRPAKPRSDPTAKRPTQKCDPYGQGGKPMTKMEAQMIQSTVHDDWTMEYEPSSDSDIPIAIYREFLHPDYLSGARFVHKVAAIAEMNAHFPCITLERRIVRRSWQVVSTVRCRTTVLDGLSANDFHLAMLIDVEVARPEVQSLLAPKDRL